MQNPKYYSTCKIDDKMFIFVMYRFKDDQTKDLVSDEVIDRIPNIICEYTVLLLHVFIFGLFYASVYKGR